jgi:hypothetical protein
MTHTVEVAAYKKLSNGQVAVCLRCCNSPATDHWHTMGVSVAADPVAREASIGSQRVFVSQQHDDALKAEAAAFAELGTVTTHNL